jgi:glutamine synthetase
MPWIGLKRARQESRVLKTGGVFTDDTIDAYIVLKIGEVNRLRMITHPIEFGMYYSM